VQIILSKLSGQATHSEEPSVNARKLFFFWLRVLVSLASLGVSFAVFLCFVGMMEGLQIALLAVVNIYAEELESKSSFASNNYQLTFR
jgi:Na+/H+ antiporter NhaC